MSDTNLVALLLNVLASQKATVPLAPFDFWIQLIPALGAALFAAAGWLKIKTALAITEKMEVSTKATAISVEKAHEAINSERSATLEEMRKLKEEVLKLSQKLAFTEGQKENAAQELLTAAVVATAQKVQAESNGPNSG